MKMWVGFGLALSMLVACGSKSDDELCESLANACGEANAEDIKSCKEALADDKCGDKARDLYECGDGKVTCEDGSAEVAEGECEAEAFAYLACAFGDGD